MRPEPHVPNTATNTATLTNGFRRLFYAHVLTLIFTAIVVAPLLLGIASIPTWLPLACCAVITVSAFVFVYGAVHRMRNTTEITASQRLGRLSLVCGLAVAQFIFVLPVFLCIYAPSIRL
jgi:uncharacterized membrane protein YidH (DUF202 family)